jgi:hypothetical protein
MVTVLDVALPTFKTTGTASPGVTFVGTDTFTWYRPKKLGASPEKLTGAEIPPMLTVGVLFVRASGELGAATPVGCLLFTCPRPVA